MLDPFSTYPPKCSYLKRTELADLREKWGGSEKVLALLQKLVQVASKLTVAVRAPSFTDDELASLLLRSRDLVRLKR